MKTRLIVLIISFLGLIITSCVKDDDVEIIYPKDYLPAYPTSYWVYSNGEIVKVEPGYHLHSYHDSINNNHVSEEVYVPKINGEFLYEYSITQNSIQFPLKELLRENINSQWTVNLWNDMPVYRKVISLNDTIVLKDSITGIDTTLTSIVSVIEYTTDLGEENYFVKEYYAKQIGLVRKEYNNYQDTLGSFIAYDLVDYFINHTFPAE